METIKGTTTLTISLMCFLPSPCEEIYGINLKIPSPTWKDECLLKFIVWSRCLTGNELNACCFDFSLFHLSQATVCWQTWRRVCLTFSGELSRFHLFLCCLCSIVGNTFPRSTDSKLGWVEPNFHEMINRISSLSDSFLLVISLKWTTPLKRHGLKNDEKYCSYLVFFFRQSVFRQTRQRWRTSWCRLVRQLNPIECAFLREVFAHFHFAGFSVKVYTILALHLLMKAVHS